MATLKANPSYRVKIKGYTDADGDEYSNLNLSLRRSQNVWRYMSSKGFDGGKAELYGYGEYFKQSPRVQENRKVELEIVK